MPLSYAGFPFARPAYTPSPCVVTFRDHLHGLHFLTFIRILTNARRTVCGYLHSLPHVAVTRTHGAFKQTYSPSSSGFSVFTNIRRLTKLRTFKLTRIFYSLDVLGLAVDVVSIWYGGWTHSNSSNMVYYCVFARRATTNSSLSLHKCIPTPLIIPHCCCPHAWYFCICPCCLCLHTHTLHVWIYGFAPTLSGDLFIVICHLLLRVFFGDSLTRLHLPHVCSLESWGDDGCCCCVHLLYCLGICSLVRTLRCSLCLWAHVHLHIYPFTLICPDPVLLHAFYVFTHCRSYLTHGDLYMTFGTLLPPHLPHSVVLPCVGTHSPHSVSVYVRATLLPSPFTIISHRRLVCLHS